MELASPKGSDMKAQGNALGTWHSHLVPALKGRHTVAAAPAGVLPFQGEMRRCRPSSQGVALGFRVEALRAWGRRLALPRATFGRGFMGRRNRRGLAPLELVLALPILLFTMALILNHGTVASWKVRALVTARHSAWASRWPRDASLAPRPAYWPSQGTSVGVTPGDIPALDDPRIDKPVVRGPLANLDVHSDLLDPIHGLRDGTSTLTRDFPLLGRIGKYRLEADAPILDNQWQYQRTNWPQQGTSVPANVWRRIPVIYLLPKADRSLSGAFYQAVMTALGAPYREALAPLDDDPEYRRITATLDPSGQGWAPNFTAGRRLAFHCTLDRAVEQSAVDDLRDRIQGRTDRDSSGRVIRHVPGLAEEMTRAILSVYNQAIAALQSQLNSTPPPSPSEVARIQAAINSLQTASQPYQQFLQTL